MSRHASIADQLAPLKSFMERPESVAEPLQTNWNVIAANDNSPEDADGKYVERRWAMRPTLQEIEAAIEDGDIKYGVHVDARGKSHKVVVSIGGLSFSDGTNTERAYAYGADNKVIMFDAILPVGAMLGTKDAQERTLGGEGASPSNRIYTDIYKAKHPGKAKRRNKDDVRRERSEDKKPSKDELRAELAEAIVNTDHLPAVVVCPKGFPWKPANLRELFLGVEKGKKGETGSIAWQDISTHIVEHEVWAETVAALSKDDKATLEAVKTAGSMADLITEAPRRTAMRKGRARLLALNDNIQAAMRKSAA